MGIIKDISGKRFGLLVAVKIDEQYKSTTQHRGYKWLCICDCGKTTSCLLSNLSTGKTKSCGCQLGHNVMHGLRHLRLYGSWDSMIRRCEDAKNIAYQWYGGRGITVCDRWHDIRNFYGDMGERPINATLDRIDNNKGYYKENCRWATRQEQSENKSSNVLLNYNGETKTIAQWSRSLGVPHRRICGRIKSGWTIEEALTIPKLKHRYQHIKSTEVRSCKNNDTQRYSESEGKCSFNREGKR